MFTTLARNLDYWVRRNRVYFLPRFHHQYRQTKKRLTNVSAARSHRPAVVFDLNDNRLDGPQGRRFYTLYLAFAKAEYQCFLVDRYGFLANSGEKFKGYVVDLNPSLLSANGSALADYLLLTDLRDSPFTANARRTFLVKGRADYVDDGSQFPWPFSMFPELYRQGKDREMMNLRENHRNWSVLFGGSLQEKKYEKASIKLIYKKIPRWDALTAVRQGLLQDEYVEPVDNNALRNLEEQEIKGLVVIRSEQCPVPPTSWLETIARSRFFLGLPGVRYPMSHNVIESMAVGTVPILQYPELFYPGLTPGRNCLAYNDEASLCKAVKRALSMSTEEWKTMSNQAALYYNRYVDLRQAVRRLENTSRAVTTLHLAPFLKPGH